MLKKLCFPLFALFLLAGCATSNNTLSLEPKITLPARNPSLNATSISVSSVDNRTSKSLAEVNRNGSLVVLSPSRDPRYLMQEAMEKQMAARGFMVSSPANVNLVVQLNQLNAQVSEGNLRHNITVNSSVTVNATAPNGSTKSRTFTRNYNNQELLGASNDKIEKAINTALADLITDMANDQELTQFIKQNSR
ncbi:putative lipoprotein [Providencia alcalifaciens]|nr:putative lipoprotein [Providencia alcalifaciens]